MGKLKRIIGRLIVDSWGDETGRRNEDNPVLFDSSNSSFTPDELAVYLGIDFTSSIEINKVSKIFIEYLKNSIE